MIDAFTGGLPPLLFATACVAVMAAGFVKGAVGFAMPLILMSLLPSFMPLQQALAAVMLPILLTNLHQTFRDGWRAAADTLRQFWRFGAAMVAGIAVSAPLLLILPEPLLMLLLGVAILLSAAVQLAGWVPTIGPRARPWAEFGMGGLSGFYGGFSGVWGPPLVSYLLAIKAEKRLMGRAMSVLFTLASILLLIAHLRTGVFDSTSAPLSAALVIPGFLGMAIGYRVQDRMDPARFRFWVTLVLIASALNLIRQGLWG